MPNSNRPLLQSECVEFTLNCSVEEESLCYIQQMHTIAFHKMAHSIMVKMLSANEVKVHLLCYAPCSSSLWRAYEFSHKKRR